jgi:hypothetical protein
MKSSLDGAKFCIACRANNGAIASPCTTCGYVVCTDFPPLDEYENAVLFPFFFAAKNDQKGWEVVAHKRQKRETWFSDAACECTNRFIRSETDFAASGNKGLGRMTSHVPRLGGWKQKDIRRLSEEHRHHLDSFIAQLILVGHGSYHTQRIVDRDVQGVEVEHLYSQWIPNIYTGWENYLIPEEVHAVLKRIGREFADVFVHQWTQILGLRTGFLWGRVTFQTIAEYYFWAGGCLANEEMQIAKELEAA